MDTIQIRIDEKTKKQASAIFDELGLDMSTGIKIYLRQLILKKALPFTLVTENGLTVEQEDEILEALKEAKQGKNVTKSFSKKEALEYLRSL